MQQFFVNLYMYIFFSFQLPSLYTVKAILILDNDGRRLIAKVIFLIKDAWTPYDESIVNFLKMKYSSFCLRSWNHESAWFLTSSLVDEFWQ